MVIVVGARIEIIAIFGAIGQDAKASISQNVLT
jgi:hypothetical protein